MDNRLILNNTNSGSHKLQLRNLWTVSRKLILKAVNILFGSLPIVVTIDPVTNITPYSATVGGNVIDDGGWPDTERGICCDTTINPTYADYMEMDNLTGEGTYSCDMTNLTPSTLYYVRAVAFNPHGIAYGQDVSFFTSAAPGGDSPLYVQIATIYGTTNNATNVVAYVQYSGSISPVYRGVCWSSSNTMPTVADSSIRDAGTGDGTYYNYLTNLTPSTDYYVRAFAYNSAQLVYSYSQQFTTTGTNPQTSAPTVSTSAPYNVSTGSATLGGYVYSDGNVSPVYRGVCYSLASSPTIRDSSAQHYATGLSYYNIDVNGLNPSTHYYTRAFAYNSAGLSYGDNYEFTTNPSLGSIYGPTVEVVNISDISTNSVKFTGNVTSTGGATTYRGACWSRINSYPTISDSSVLATGSGLGYYDVSITGLDCSTTYYVRAFSYNSAGLSYGSRPPSSIYTFSTSPCITTIVAPTVITYVASGVSSTSATLSGAVTSIGSDPSTRKGFTWATHANPIVTTDSSTIHPYLTGSGPYDYYLSGLSMGTTYYYRAFAYNSAGLSYGADVSFNTTSTSYTAPTVITSPATNIYSSSATTGGNVTHDGYIALTYRGICISTNANPTILDTSILHAGTGEGTYACNFSNLSSNTVYYSRAFAYNTSGLSYGSDASFYTLPSSPEIKSIHSGFYDNIADYVIPTNASAGDFIFGVLTTRMEFSSLVFNTITTSNFAIAFKNSVPMQGAYNVGIYSIAYYGISNGASDRLTIRSCGFDYLGEHYDTLRPADARSLTYVIKNHNVTDTDFKAGQWSFTVSAAGYPVNSYIIPTTLIRSQFLAKKVVRALNQPSLGLFVRIMPHAATAKFVNNQWVQPPLGFTTDRYDVRTEYHNRNGGQASMAGCSAINYDTSMQQSVWTIQVDETKEPRYDIEDNWQSPYQDIIITIG